MLAHLRWPPRVRLLAAGVLSGREREEVAAHVASCERCRREHIELSSVIEELRDDPLRTAEPEVPLAVLVGRVEDALDRAKAPRPRARPWLVALPAAAAILAAVALAPPLVDRVRDRTERESRVPSSSPMPVTPDTEVVLVRLERNLAREHAAHYLSEARDVLVSVAATGVDCDREEELVDVGEAPDRSRELLARRTLLVEPEGEAVASARAVLDDVELALREVADLPSCVKRKDVERLRQQVEKRRLLMRIRLMTRELEG